jgi:hypothetical protein
VNLRGKLETLRAKIQGPQGDRCPRCGSRPDDIRIFHICPIGEPEVPVPEFPPEDYCEVCGKLLPPIRFIQSDWTDAGAPEAGGSLDVATAGRQAGRVAGRGLRLRRSRQRAWASRSR